MNWRLKRIAPLQLGKILGLIYGLVSLLIVPFFVLVGLAAAIGGGQGNAPMPAWAMLGFALVAPFFYAAMGFLTGVVGAFVYNLVASWIGGVEVSCEQVP